MGSFSGEEFLFDGNEVILELIDKGKECLVVLGV